MALCEIHHFEPAHATCRTCKREFCPDCLVYPFGPKKAPICVPCALEAAGVRRTRGGRQAIRV